MNRSKFQGSLTGFLLAMAFYCTAQPPFDFNWGPVSDMDKYKYMTGMVAAKDGSFIAVRQTFPPSETFGIPGGEPSLVLFDPDMKRVKSAPLDLTHQGKDLIFFDLTAAGSRFYVFTTLFDKKLKKAFFFARLVNPETLSLEGEFIQLGEVPKSNPFDPAVFGFALSPDSIRTKVLIYCLHKENDEKRVTLSLRDDQMQSIWTKETVLPDVELFENQFEVDDAGNVFFLTGRLDLKKGSNRIFEAFTWRNNGEDFQDYKVDLGSKFVKNISILPLKNGELICAGFYGDEIKKGINGVFFYTVTPQGGPQPTVIQPFDKTLFAGLQTEKQKQKGKQPDEDQGLQNYELRKLLFRSNGSVVIVGEQAGEIDLQSSGKDAYFQGSLIVVNFSPDRQIDWIVPVVKSQLSGEASAGSFIHLDTGDQLHFVYFQTPNLGQPDIKMTTIHRDGQSQTVTLAEKMNGNPDMKVRINGSGQTGNKTLVLYTEDRKFYRFARLKFH